MNRQVKKNVVLYRQSVGGEPGFWCNDRLPLSPAQDFCFSNNDQPADSGTPSASSSRLQGRVRIDKEPAPDERRNPDHDQTRKDGGAPGIEIHEQDAT